MAHIDCCGPSRRQALPWGSLAAAVPAIVAAVSADSAKASTTDLLVTDLDVATVTDTSVITALVHRLDDRAGHLRIPAPRRGSPPCAGMVRYARWSRGYGRRQRRGRAGGVG